MRMTRPWVSTLRKLGTRLLMKCETSSPTGGSCLVSSRCDFGTNSPIWMKKYGSSSAMTMSCITDLSLDSRPLAIERTIFNTNIVNGLFAFESHRLVPASDYNCQYLQLDGYTYGPTRVLSHGHGVNHSWSENRYAVSVRTGAGNVKSVPWTTFLNVPPGQDIS